MSRDEEDRKRSKKDKKKRKDAAVPLEQDRKRKREDEPDKKKKKKRVEDFLEKHSITIHTPPSVPSIPPVTSFDQLDIPDGLGAAFDGFKEPTPIQAAAWPWALSGRDVIGIAETGRYVHLYKNTTPCLCSPPSVAKHWHLAYPH